MEKYAVLSQDGLGLRIIDLSVPSDSLDFGLYPLIGTAFHLAHWRILLLVSGGDPDIKIVEISLPNMQDPPFNLLDQGAEPIMTLAAWNWKVYAATGREVVGTKTRPQKMKSPECRRAVVKSIDRADVEALLADARGFHQVVGKTAA